MTVTTELDAVAPICWAANATYGHLEGVMTEVLTDLLL